MDFLFILQSSSLQVQDFLFIGLWAFFLKIYYVKLQVEKLIKELPSVPADWTNGDINSAEKDHLSNGISLQYTENGTNLRETQSMLLERIASEMNRLNFYITQAQVYLAFTLALTLLAFLLFLVFPCNHCSNNLFSAVASVICYEIFCILGSVCVARELSASCYENLLWN